MEVDSGKTVVLAALGRPFSLGMLYDCRSDSLIPAFTLWDREALEENVVETAQANSDFEIVASDSIEDKSSALDVEASLKASFLCGMVELDGSAKFLSDSKMSRNQARVTLKYKTTTKFKQLSMNHIGRGNQEHPYVFESGEATHLVTGILYGAQAFFVFDRELSEKEDQQDIEGNLKVLIKKIPALKIDGQGALTMGDKDIANVDKFSCKFHGDFNLEKHPVSFQEAIEVYQSLPKLIGTNGENAVPQKVWLKPLKTLNSAAVELVRQISDRLIMDAQNILEDLSELERRCNDAQKCKTTQQFQQITKKVTKFKGYVSQYKLEFQKIMAGKLPLIRGGGEKEGVLAEILKKVHSSPFNPENLQEWIDIKETEIHFISSLIDKLPNMTIVSTPSTLLRAMFSSVRYTVCFVLTSLETPEPYLSTLANYLERAEPNNESCAHDVEKEQWSLSNKTRERVHEKLKLFKNFAEANKENLNIQFLITAISDDDMKGATVHLYEVSLLCKNFEPPSNPEMITANTSHNSVTLRISPPRFGSTSVTHYTVEFCVHGDNVWHEQKESKAGEVTVSGLRVNQAYRFRCRAVCQVGLGPACEAISVKTLPHSSRQLLFLKGLKKESKKIKKHPGSLEVFALCLKPHPNNVAGCKRFVFGKDSAKRNRTIMVLGGTGAGKSTLVNGMINHILGVKWEDTFRFKLVDDGTAKSQAHSQTSEVSAYKLNHREDFQIDYSLTIVDTPGFGDTRGIERDRDIIQQVENLFSSELGVSEIDVICFVAQASLARLTSTQKYIFDSVLSIFGKDVAENIQILVTFADGQPPPVLVAINEAAVPCPKEENGLPINFQFNNSALFIDNKGSAAQNRDRDSNEYSGSGIPKMLWDMGNDSMKRFFAALNSIDTKSLTLTKEVLRQRGQLEISIENLQKNVKLGLAKIEGIERETNVLQTHKAAIIANGDFEYEFKEQKPIQIDITGSGKYITNCQQCHTTCHFPCAISNDAQKAGCAAMGKDGNCKQCCKHCPWSVHFNQKYRWDYQEVTEKRTYKDLKEKYEKATQGAMSIEDILKKMKAEYDQLQLEVGRLMEESTYCLNRLKEIALRPNPLSTPDYIDLLIEGEKSEAMPGYQERIKELQNIREKAVTMGRVASGDKLF